MTVSKANWSIDKPLTLKILIADDHPLFREAVRTALGGLAKAEPVTFVEAGSADEAKRLIDREHDLGLLLLDLNMPGMSGFAGLVDIRKLHPALPIVIVSATDDVKVMRDCITYGAMGFIHKSSDRASMANAVRQVLDGDIYLPDSSALSMEDRASASDGAGEKARLIRSLTRQQLRVLEALAKGQPNKIIAHELGLAEKTVKAHVTAILQKLKVTNRTQAVLMASDFLNAGSN
jgi:DNA-binding NarL/FixJ family response regulator